MTRSARALTPGRKMPLADQPVGVRGGLAEQPLLEAGAEDVGDRLVQRARTGPGRRGPAVYWVTAWVSSWPSTSTGLVNRSKTWPSPSPNTSWVPSQNALS